jgi:hypothetical protein
MSNLHTCKKIIDVPNCRNINAYYVGPTTHRHARICIEEKARDSSSKVARKYFSFDYQFGDLQKQAFRILQKAGFKISWPEVPTMINIFFLWITGAMTILKSLTYDKGYKQPD